MYDELVKRLRELQTITEHCDEQSCDECENRELCDKHDNKTLSGTYKEAADAIEELARRNAQFMYTPPPAWVSVKERLPKMHQWVLVASKLVKIRMDFISSDGHWYTTSGVTHWMPLPKPPEEKDDR